MRCLAQSLTPDERLARHLRAGLAAEARGIRIAQQQQQWQQIVAYQVIVSWEVPDPQTSMQHEAYSALMRGRCVRYRGPWLKRSEVFTMLGDAEAKAKKWRASKVARSVSWRETQIEPVFGDARWCAASGRPDYTRMGWKQIVRFMEPPMSVPSKPNIDSVCLMRSMVSPYRRTHRNRW